MIRISDQYFWNLIFSFLFLCFAVSAAIIIDSEAAISLKDLTFMEFLILSLATLRLTRLFVYDKITAFFREQFWDVVETKTKRTLEKPLRGPRRTMADLLSCPWCCGVWSGAVVVFAYYAIPATWYFILFLAIAGAGTLLQILGNWIGWKAEQGKRDVEG